MSRYFIVASKIFFSCKVKEPVVRLDGVDLNSVYCHGDFTFYVINNLRRKIRN